MSQLYCQLVTIKMAFERFTCKDIFVKFIWNSMENPSELNCIHKNLIFFQYLNLSSKNIFQLLKVRLKSDIIICTIL